MPASPIPWTQQSPRQREIGDLEARQALLEKQWAALGQERNRLFDELNGIHQRIRKLEDEDRGDTTPDLLMPRPPARLEKEEADDRAAE